MADPTEQSTPQLDRTTTLAFDRTLAAYDRTILSWVRTATSLITFGFSIYKFFEYFGESTGGVGLRHGPLNLGRVMVVLGVLLLVPAIVQHWQFLRRLSERADRRFPPSLALVTAGQAQRGGITPEMIATALPLEGAPLAIPGPYKVESGPAAGSPGHVVYHPADLAPFRGTSALPLMVWGNGGCAINSTRYGGFLTTIASHGFVVMATAAEPGAERRRATADDLRAAIKWAETENTRALSLYQAFGFAIVRTYDYYRVET